MISLSKDAEGAEGDGEGETAKKKKKKKKNKKKGGQTDPPSLPIVDLFQNGLPEGEILQYAALQDE